MENHVPVHLAYDLFESAKGSDPNLRSIIFLHGFASDRKTWRNIPQIIAEKTNRKVYAYDARNFGDSDYTDEFSVPSNVEDLFHFMNTVNLQTAVIFGHSMGGYTAMNAALRKPERIEMLISEDTFLGHLEDEEYLFAGKYVKDLAHAISKIPSSVDESEAAKIVIDEMYDGLSEENKKWTPKESLHKLYVPIKRDADGQYIANYNAKTLYKATRQTRNLKMEHVGLYEGPAIWLHGTKSNMDMLSNMSHIKRYFPKAEFIEFEGASHSVHAEFREKTIDTIVHLLNKYNIA